MNTGDVDGAMALIADDAKFDYAPPSGATLTTRDDIRSWVQRQVDGKIVAALRDIQVNGDKASWYVKVTRNGSVLSGGPGHGEFADGKLKMWTFK